MLSDREDRERSRVLRRRRRILRELEKIRENFKEPLVLEETKKGYVLKITPKAMELISYLGKLELIDRKIKELTREKTKRKFLKILGWDWLKKVRIIRRISKRVECYSLKKELKKWYQLKRVLGL